MSESQWIVGASAALFRIKETGKCFVPQAYIAQPLNVTVQILLTRRSNNKSSYPGCLTCPGGKPNHSNEPPHKVVIREVLEEVGLNFNPTSLFSHPNHMWFSKDSKRGYITNLHLGEWSGEITIQTKEVASYAWYSYEDLKNEQMAFDYRRIIDYMHEVNIF